MLKIDKMKKSLIFLLLLLVQMGSCQTPILPLSTYEHIPNGAYIKDVNNELLHYIGTWEGVLNNKKYTFEFVKFESHFNNLFYKDELLCKFKVTDLSTGNILYNDLNIYNYDGYKIYALTPPHRGMLHCIFTDTNENCNNTLEFYLRNINGQSNKLTYCYFRYTDEWGILGNGCPNYEDRMTIPIYLPTEDLILTKL